MLSYLNLSRFVNALSVLCFTLLFTVGVAAQTQGLLIGYAGDRGTSSENGVKRGIIEANLQGEFLGVEYRLVPLDTFSSAATTQPRVIIVAAPDEEVLGIAAKYRHIPVLNIKSTSDHLRATCMPNLFHTMPSQQMFSDALAQWRTKHPSSPAQAQAWHRKFKKYAASQLNIRYHETFAADMDDEAWAGWAAAKLVADTLIASPALENEELLRELKTNLAFDGQKGIDMRFRETGQLAQPILIIEDDEIRGEAPVRGVVDITDLDSLGELRCPK